MTNTKVDTYTPRERLQESYDNLPDDGDNHMTQVNLPNASRHHLLSARAPDAGRPASMIEPCRLTTERAMDDGARRGVMNILYTVETEVKVLRFVLDALTEEEPA